MKKYITYYHLSFLKSQNRLTKLFFLQYEENIIYEYEKNIFFFIVIVYDISFVK